MPPTSVSILLAADMDGTAAQRTLMVIAETADAGLDYEVVVVNASDSPRFKQFLGQIEGAIRVVEADPGVGRSDLLREAADAATSERLVILDSRVVPCDGWLEGLLDAAGELGERLGIAGSVVVDSSGGVVEAGYVYDGGMAVSVAGMVESSGNAWLAGFREVAAAGFFGCILPASLLGEVGWMESGSSFTDAWAAYCGDVGRTGRAVGIACGSRLAPPSYGLRLQRPGISDEKVGADSGVEVAREMIESMREGGQMTETGERVDSSGSSGESTGNEGHWSAYAAIAGMTENRRVIDVGCGGGYGSHVLGGGSGSVLGIDERPEKVVLAKALWGGGNVGFEVGGASDVAKIAQDRDCAVIVADADEIPGIDATLATMSAGLTDRLEAVVAIVGGRDEAGVRGLYAGFLRGFFRRVEPMEGGIEGSAAATVTGDGSNAKRLSVFTCGSPRPSEADLTSIVIPAMERVTLTKNCLEAVRAHTDSRYELIVVNNGSTDGTAEYLAQQSDVRVITNRVNQGFATGVNQGMREASGERILVLGLDTLVAPGWLRRMNDQMDRSGASIVGPLSNYATADQTVENVPYEASDTAGILEFAEQTARDNRGKYTPITALSGLCLLVDRSVLRRIGGFDPIFNPGNWEDVDFGLRAHASGFRSVIAHDVFVHHYGGQEPRWNQLVQKNWEKFKKKWGVEVSAASQNWVDEVPRVSFTLLARDREWRFCFNDSIWERPAAEIRG